MQKLPMTELTITLTLALHEKGIACKYNARYLQIFLLNSKLLIRIRSFLLD